MSAKNHQLDAGDEMYTEDLLDLYRDPLHAGRLKHPSFEHQEWNPLCGDEVRLSIRVKDRRVIDAAFEGQGCVISQASASMFCGAICGKTLEEIAQWTPETIRQFLGGITLSPSRWKCALLVCKTFEHGKEIYEQSLGK